MGFLAPTLNLHIFPSPKVGNTARLDQQRLAENTSSFCYIMNYIESFFYDVRKSFRSQANSIVSSVSKQMPFLALTCYQIGGPIKVDYTNTVIGEVIS